MRLERREGYSNDETLKDDAELYKQFSDNPDFRRWLTDTVFSMTYDEAPQRAATAASGV
jgi:hypothetical protein